MKRIVFFFLSCTFVYAQDPIPIPFQKFDVAAIGYGNAYTANGQSFNGMLYNPALLGRTSDRVEVLNLGLYIGTSTVDAIKQVIDKQTTFKRTPKVFSDAQRHIDNYVNYPSILNERLAQRSLLKVDDVISVVDRLNNTVQTDPIGAGIYPGLILSKSFGKNHFGFAAYSNLSVAMKIKSGPAIDSLLSIRTLGYLENNIDRVESVLNDFTTDEGPQAEGFGVWDYTFVAGYARPFTDNITAGINVKYIIRKTSAQTVSLENQPIDAIKDDLKKSNSKFGIDIGVTYQADDRTTLAAALQDAIATEKDIKSGAGLNNYFTEIPAVRILRIGVYRQINDHIFVSGDIDDVLDQSGLYEKWIDRVKLGGEYRIDAGYFKFPLRAGIGQGGITAGAGVYVIRFMRIDYAFAKDHALESFYRHNLQIGFMFGI